MQVLNELVRDYRADPQIRTLMFSKILLLYRRFTFSQKAESCFAITVFDATSTCVHIAHVKAVEA